MHDVRAIREEPERFISGWERRGVQGARGVVEQVLADDRALRAGQTELQQVQARRNEASKLIGAAKAQRDEARAAELMAQVEALKGVLAESEAEQKAAEAELNGQNGVLAKLPNLAAEGVPRGEDETGNVEQTRVGDPAATPAGRAGLTANHADLGERLGLMDFEAAARMSGSRFVALKGQLARLERALGQFMLDVQTTRNGYTEVSPPLLVRDDAMFGTGQLPKFKLDLFVAQSLIEGAREAFISGLFESYRSTLMPSWQSEINSTIRAVGVDQAGTTAQAYVEAKVRELRPEVESQVRTKIERGEMFDQMFLIPTAEVSLTNLVREQVTAEEELPLRLTALTPCFRSEAGASGRDTRGMIRQHQFYKVEMVSITAPEQSDAEHERMTACAEGVLEALGLPYRRMLLCDGDMGFSARRTFDLEVWLPSEGRYREISSCSNCGDFQARRMDARTKAAGGKGTRFVHTLNGSGLAVGRALVAVMETYQDEGGRIAVPDALLPYTGGMTHVGGA